MNEPKRSRRDLILARSAVVAAACIVLATGFALFARFAFVPELAEHHSDAQRVRQVQGILDAIVPATDVQGSAADICVDPAHEALNVPGLIGEVDAKLSQLAEEGFLGRSYRLDPARLAGAGGAASCAAIARGLREIVVLQLLRRVQWRERSGRWTAGDATFARVEESAFRMKNPWRSLPGCILVAHPDSPKYIALAGSTAVCGGLLEDAKPSDSRSTAFRAELYRSDFISALGAEELTPWRNSDSPLFQRLVGDANTVTGGPYGGRTVGFHIVMTLDAELQAISQAIANCYSGNLEHCASIGVDAQAADGYYERARARLAGVAVIDVASGRIEAVASAESDCYKADTEAGHRALSRCPEIGTEKLSPVPRSLAPAAYRNHAVVTAAPPASTIKPIMLTGFLTAARDAVSLSNDAVRLPIEEAFRKSLTPRFLDWIYCRDRGVGIPASCGRPMAVQAAATALGFNLGCDGSGASCGELDILFGRPGNVTSPVVDEWGEEVFKPVEKRVLLGRLLTTGTEDRRLLTEPEMFGSVEELAACAEREWAECRRIPPAVAELWGDGNARATPLGVATVMANLAAAANGETASPYPRLIKAMLRADGTPDPAADKARQWGYVDHPPGVNADAARQVIRLMETTHAPGGTAHASCVRAGAQCPLAGLAGKTGTTAFPDTVATLRNLKQTCAQEARAGLQAGRCKKRPWRWFVGAFKSDPASPRWDKAFAVLIERNWRNSGEVGENEDEAMENAAVEMGVVLVERYRAALTRSQPPSPHMDVQVPRAQDAQERPP